MQLLTLFLLVVAGVDLATMAETPLARRKYAAIGTMILITSGLAALSGTYAMFVVFRSHWAFAFGAFYALTVGAIDRTLVMSTTGGGLRARLFVALRIAIALVLAAVMSEPLVLRVFEPEITAQIAEDVAKETIAAERTGDQMYPRIGQLEHHDDSLRTAIALKKAAVDSEFKVMQAEAAGKALIGADGVLTGHRGFGPQFRLDSAHHAATLNDLAALESSSRQQLDLDRQELDSLVSLRAAAVRRIGETHAAATGILARLHALAELKARSPELQRANVALFLALTILDLSAILAKLLMARDSYEARVERKEAEAIHTEDVATVMARLEAEAAVERGKAQTTAVNGFIGEITARTVAEAMTSPAIKSAQLRAVAMLVRAFVRNLAAAARASAKTYASDPVKRAARTAAQTLDLDAARAARARRAAEQAAEHTGG